MKSTRKPARVCLRCGALKPQAAFEDDSNDICKGCNRSGDLRSFVPQKWKRMERQNAPMTNTKRSNRRGGR